MSPSLLDLETLKTMNLLAGLLDLRLKLRKIRNPNRTGIQSVKVPIAPADLLCHTPCIWL